MWEPLFQHYNGNVDHFFFSPFIYFSCIRSNWNYTPYVYYMTLMRLDQCRRWVYLKLLHKPSAYEKRVFFFLCRLSSSWHRWFFHSIFTIPYIISQFDIAFFARVLYLFSLRTTLCSSCWFVGQLYLFIFIYSKVIQCNVHNSWDKTIKNGSEDHFQQKPFFLSSSRRKNVQ